MYFRDVEITIYHDGTYGISKEAVPIFINDLLSLKKLITIFYGTPFNLNFEKFAALILTGIVSLFLKFMSRNLKY